VFGARGEDEQQFGLRRHRTDLGIEQQTAQPFAERCPPGLSGQHHLRALIPQPPVQALELGGLSRALDPLEGDEATAPRRTHRCAP
jgi:hypothetical protein